jgi:hypothetical protein
MPQLPDFLFLISYFLFSNVTLPIEKPTLQEGLIKTILYFQNQQLAYRNGRFKQQSYLIK